MTVLIDPPTWPAHGTVWSHLVSDRSLAELHAFADVLGIGRRAFDLDHYDVPAERYADAVAAGAEPVDGRELLARLTSAGLRVRGRDRRAAKAEVLLARWDALLPGARAVGHELVERWGEAHRVYHDRAHLAYVLDSLAVLTDRPERLAALALWFHDAVHDGVARQDEERSAELVVTLLGPRLTAGDIEEVARLVLLTADHDPAPDDRHGALVSDADLAILGSAPDRYARYTRQVRAEYADVPDDAFRAGRAGVLERLLGSGALYRTDVGAGRWADRAETNLRAELADLRSPRG